MARTSSSERSGGASATGAGASGAALGGSGQAGEEYASQAALRGRRRRSRPLRIVSIVLGIVVFLGISSVVARFFAAENVERDHELLLVQAEAKGDVAGMLAQLPGCAGSPGCVARVRANAAQLRRGGAVEILSTQSAANHSLTGSVGKTRVAWKVSGRYPVIQCVTVRRGGNFLTGISITLLAIGPRIGSTSDC